jgi:hypothetical protein
MSFDITMSFDTHSRSALDPILAATTASADFPLQFITVTLSGIRRDLPR